MRIPVLFLLLITLLLPACSKQSSKESAPSQGVTSELSQRQAGDFLAYTHTITVDLDEEAISAAYSATMEACLADEEYGCTILDSRISQGRYPAAYIRLRTKPKGVKPIVSIASGKGEVSQESTHVEDLAQPVMDLKKRLAMLESHRDTLLQLREKATNDIQALIKVSEELAKVQSELESATGEDAHLQERIKKDIVEIHFDSVSHRSFWRPISEALSDFTGDLSTAISGMVHVVAYLLPWLVLGFPALFAFRFVWRRGKRW